MDSEWLSVQGPWFVVRTASGGSARFAVDSEGSLLFRIQPSNDPGLEVSGGLSVEHTDELVRLIREASEPGELPS